MVGGGEVNLSVNESLKSPGEEDMEGMLWDAYIVPPTVSQRPSYLSKYSLDNANICQPGMGDTLDAKQFCDLLYSQTHPLPLRKMPC